MPEEVHHIITENTEIKETLTFFMNSSSLLQKTLLGFCFLVSPHL